MCATHYVALLALAATALLLCLTAQPAEATTTNSSTTSWKRGGGHRGRQRPQQEKYLELDFFFHDDLRVPNASAFFIVPPLDGDIQPFFLGNSFFGAVVVFDDLLTVDPDPESLAIGRAKGVYVWDNKVASAPSTELIFTVVFNEASGFPGSTISFRGFNPITGTTGAEAPVREISISGGTSHFRLARGWAKFRLYSVYANNYAAVVKVTASIYYGGGYLHD